MQGARTRAMLVDIGCKYDGIPFDRPALRKLPHGWRLAIEDEKRLTPLGIAITIAAAAWILALAFVAVQLCIGR